MFTAQNTIVARNHTKTVLLHKISTQEYVAEYMYSDITETSHDIRVMFSLYPQYENGEQVLELL